jgi:hypothetical protein
VSVMTAPRSRMAAERSGVLGVDDDRMVSVRLSLVQPNDLALSGGRTQRSDEDERVYRPSASAPG